jgi:hypothetical protein
MLNGYVIWFGGKNNKLNEINDYGYIKYIDNGISRDIKFFRYEITEHEQFILETKRHRKIKIAFDLDSLNHKYPVAVNINLNSLIGTVVKIKDDRKNEISCEGYDNFDVFQSISKVNVGDVVLLTDSYDEELKDDEFILLKTINASIQDYKIKAKCTQNNDFNIFKLFLVDYLVDLPPESAIAFILQKMDDISESDRIELIKYLTDKISNIVITSIKLRALLSRYDRERYISLILKQIDRVDRSLRQELVDEICHLLKDINDVNENDRSKLILWLYKEASNTVAMSAELRMLLMEYSQVSYISLLGTYLGQVDSEVKEELLSEIFNNLADTTDSEKNNYWKKIAYLRENVEYRGYLWSIATNEVKKELTTIKFESFLKIVAEFNKSEYPYGAAISADWRQLYEFDPIDNQLINSWTGENTTSVLKDRISVPKAQMISARGAEKFVIQFYKELGYSVEDISSHQITSVSQAWITGDIRLDSDRLLDVKNARTSPNTTSYSEFCVKQLKKESGKDVDIVAVLSPFLKGTEIESGKVENPKRDKGIKILGEFCETDLESFKKMFEGNLISIDFSTRLDKNKYLPHWLFDYNNKFYKNQIELISQFSQLEENAIPDVDDLSTLGIKSTKYLSFFIAVGRKLPTSWTESILDWQINFIDSLIDLKQSRISLPLIFLSLLTHFLSILSSSESDSNYSPSKYKEILYSDSGNKHPLKVYDPLNTINDFCDSLQSIWDYRGQAKLNEFKIFKFDGKGLLSGQRSSQDRNNIRLLAYCGGLNKDGSSCGCAPLVIGNNDTCASCNCLICKKCDCCFVNCPGYKSRLEIKKLNQKKIPDPIRKVNDRA